MSATKKASIMDCKKFFYPATTAAEFNADWKNLSDKDKSELQDLLGTALETGAVQLP